MEARLLMVVQDPVAAGEGRYPVPSSVILDLLLGDEDIVPYLVESQINPDTAVDPLYLAFDEAGDQILCFEMGDGSVFMLDEVTLDGYRARLEGRPADLMRQEAEFIVLEMMANATESSEEAEDAGMA